MAIVKKKNSKYLQIVLWQNGKHHWFSSKTDNIDLAKIREAQLMASIKGTLERHRLIEFIESFTHQPIEAGLPLVEAWQVYADQSATATRSEYTLKSKRTSWRGFLKWLKSNRPEVRYMHEIDRNIAGQYMDSIREKVSGKSFKNMKTNLRSTVQQLVMPANMKENPFSFISLEPVQMKSFRPFTGNEIKRILKKLDPEWKTASLIALYSGLRFGDISNLKPEHINLKKNAIILRPRKTARFDMEVIIPLHSNLRKIIIPLMNQEYFCPRIHQGYTNKLNSVLLTFGKVLKDLKITGNVSFHSLRHTFNDTLVSKGVRQEDRMRLTGHSDAKTNDIYTHDIEPLRKAVSLLPDWSAK